MAWTSSVTRPLYESAEALIYDPVPANRDATLAALQAIGFSSIRLTSDLRELNDVLSVSSPDLLLCEVAGSESELCGFIQSMRQGAMGKNPFLVVMATTWRRDGTIVNQVVNSGADDLLCRPFASTLLAERIRIQIERRKGFVVTADYIGPDRRRDSSRSGSECIQVPNSLKVKTVSGLPAAGAERLIAEEIRRARERIDSEKLRRNAFQLCVQWRMLEQRRAGGQEFSEALARMKALGEDTGRRAAATARIQTQAMHWCESMAQAIAAIEAMVAGKEEGLMDLGPPMRTLGEAAMTLGRTLAPADLNPSRMGELDALVTRLQAIPGEGAPARKTG
jgi:DNA-binding response OmpR family regulator